MTDYRPRLRPNLTVEDGRLVDSMLDRTFPLEGAIAELAGRLDGAAPWPAIRDALVDGGLDPDDVDGSMRGLLCLHLVEGAGDAHHARLATLLGSTGDLPVSTIPGARFACQGSGGCCTGYSFGPLADEDLARLDQLDLATAFPHLAAPYHEVGETGRFLRRDGDRCIFLAGDNRCGLHAAFGADSKPGFCRLYPHDPFMTVEGLRIVDRGTCARFGTSARTGLPLVDDVARIVPLIGRPVLHHPLVVVDGRPWDYALFLRFTTAAGALVDRGLETASETLAAIARLFDALAGAVRACPIEPGQPDQAADEVLAVDGASWYREPDHVAAVLGQRRLVSLLDEMAPAMSAAIALGKAPSIARRMGELVAIIEHIADQVADREGGSELLVHAPEVDLALRISLRQQLFSRRALVGGHAGTGLIRLGLIQLFALSAARLDAGPRPLVASDLDRGHSLATRVLESGSLDRVMAYHEPRWREMVEGIAVAARVVAA